MTALFHNDCGGGGCPACRYDEIGAAQCPVDHGEQEAKIAALEDVLRDLYLLHDLTSGDLPEPLQMKMRKALGDGPWGPKEPS